MKNNLIALACTLSLAFSVYATDATPPTQSESPSEAKSLIYKPPLRGAPRSRISGGSRGTAQPTLYALAPDDTGLTHISQPTLYWFLSTAASVPVEITLIEANPNTARPLFTQTLPAPQRAGIHTLRLSDQAIHLQPDLDYEWTVALIYDPSQRAHDVLSGGVIRYQPPTAGRMTPLKAASPEQQVLWYAETGFWYDLIDLLSTQMAAHPNESLWHDYRTDLLRQVGLSEIVDAIH